MSNASNKIFSHTHYGVSTITAVLYAIAWLLGNQVHAEVAVESHVLPAVVVTASRAVATVATLDPVIVTGHRAQVSYAMLEPVIVSASRDISSGERATMYPIAFATALPVASTINVENGAYKKGLIAKVRSWMANALLK